MSTSRSFRTGTSRAVLALMVVASAGCQMFGGSCLADAPTSCPPNPPTYAQVQPILGHACVLCHAPDAQLSTLPLDTYEAVFARRDAAEKLVSTCAMPRDGVLLSDEERRTLLNWFVCDAPR